MYNCNVCIHTTDSKYSNSPELSESSFSALNIGTHKLKENLNALNHRVWDDSEPVYWQMDSEYEHLTYQQQVDLTKFAFLETSLLTKLKIRQRRRQSGDAHIKINWLGSKDEKYFKDRASVLAFAYGPQKGIGGDITMNADHLWLLRKEKLTAIEAFEKGYIDNYDKSHPTSRIKFYDPAHTMKHEGGGHSCGMRHIEDVNQKYDSIMYPFYNGKRNFGDVEINYLFTLYDKVGYWQRVRNLIAHRMGRF